VSEKKETMKDIYRSAMKFFILLLLIPVSLGFPAIAYAEDLLAVYRQAASNSPVLGKAKAQLQAEEASGSVARAALYPKVNAYAGVNYYHSDMRGFPLLTIDESYNAANYSVTLTQPIVSGRDWVAVRASESRIGAAESAVLAVEQDLILRVSEAYFGVLRARANELVAAGQKDLLKKILEEAEAFLRVGTGDIVSVREARARCTNCGTDPYTPNP
jgi:outer membrane protein